MSFDKRIFFQCVFIFVKVFCMTKGGLEALRVRTKQNSAPATKTYSLN